MFVKCRVKKKRSKSKEISLFLTVQITKEYIKKILQTFPMKLSNHFFLFFDCVRNGIDLLISARNETKTCSKNMNESIQWIQFKFSGFRYIRSVYLSLSLSFIIDVPNFHFSHPIDKKENRINFFLINE